MKKMTILLRHIIPIVGLILCYNFAFTQSGLTIVDGTSAPFVNGILSDLVKPTTTAWKYAVLGRIESGTGNAVGLRGVSLTNNPSNEGRSYGVYASASNATPGYNYAVFGELRGVNEGTGVLGWDRINNPNWDLNVGDHWAGYFVGKTYFTDTLQVNTGGVMFPDGTVQITANSSSGGKFVDGTPNTNAAVYTTGNVGIGTTNPLSLLSVNGDGTSGHGFSLTDLNTTALTHGVFSELTKPTTSAWKYSVMGRIESGTGNAVGLRGISLADNPSNEGRSYGVYGSASNATPGYNYAIFGELRGVNKGTGVLGWDRINNPNWGLDVAGHWAGYFVGKTCFTDTLQVNTGGVMFPDGTVQITANSSSGGKFIDGTPNTNAAVYTTGNVGIGTTNPLSLLSVNGDGTSGHGISLTDLNTIALTHGVFSELTKPTTSAWKYSVMGRIESGTGNAVGLRGISLADNPSNEGRSYGVYGSASNATPGYNYAIFGELRGVNKGTGVLGWDRINNPNWGLDVAGHWAGYFVGKTCFTDTLQVNTGGVMFPDGTVQITANSSSGGKFVDGTPNTNAAVYTTGNVGIGTTNPLSLLSVNGDGTSGHGISLTDLNTIALTHGVVAELAKPTTSAWKYSVMGRIESGAGNAVGLRGISLADNPSNEGRSYGVYASASNATPGYNYAVFGELRGTNEGTGVLGWDRINNPNWGLNVNGHWAGYFVGKTYFSDLLEVGAGGIMFPDGTIQTTADDNLLEEIIEEQSIIINEQSTKNSLQETRIKKLEHQVNQLNGVVEKTVIERKNGNSELEKEYAKKVETLENQVKELTVMVQQLMADKISGTKKNSQVLLMKERASLSQNYPNPFNQSTTVDYYIPETVKEAFLQVTSVEGKLLEKIQLQQKGEGQVQIQSAIYTGGTFYYSLLIDGKVVETKRMVMTK